MRKVSEIRGVAHRLMALDYKTIDILTISFVSKANMQYCTCCGILKCKSEFYVKGKDKLYTRTHCADCHDKGTRKVKERLIYDYEHTKRKDISPKVLKRILTERKKRMLKSYEFDIGSEVTISKKRKYRKRLSESYELDI